MRWPVPVALVVCVFATACGPDTPKSTTPTAVTPPTERKERLQEPCHPGCFPAGTLVNIPAGLRAIETIRTGETVSIVQPDGTATSGPVEGLFETCNKLLDVKTDAGTLRTTETQPLCLPAGGFRAAGELKAGDTIWKWVDGKRSAATVKEVMPVEGTSTVFNLVVGTDKVFVANGFLARGKPPTAP